MRRPTLLLAFATLAACDAGAQKPAPGPMASPSPDAVPIAQVATVTEWATGLEHAWGLAFLPDGRALVTERPGRLRFVNKDGSLSAPIAGVPEVKAESQGGLLDVAVDPKFAENRAIYLSYSEPGDRDNISGTAVLRATLGNTALENVQVIYRQVPKVQSGHHFGSRLVFGTDGTLYITQGDRYNQRPKVQDLASTVGKVVRINTDGTIPKDNPFVGQAGAREEIWSLGHRNAQGATLHPETGQLWTVEHGAMGGDELNRPEKGKNYGWPVITYGVDYSGAKIGEGSSKAGMEQPVYYWDPSIAPSGLVVYTGDKFAQWKGDFLLGSLKFAMLVRLHLENGKVVREDRYEVKKRVRDVVQGPDGFIYLVTDEDKGGVLRLEPKTR